MISNDRLIEFQVITRVSKANYTTVWTFWSPTSARTANSHKKPILGPQSDTANTTATTTDTTCLQPRPQHPFIPPHTQLSLRPSLDGQRRLEAAGDKRPRVGNVTETVPAQRQKLNHHTNEDQDSDLKVEGAEERQHHGQQIHRCIATVAGRG